MKFDSPEEQKIFLQNIFELQTALAKSALIKNPEYLNSNIDFVNDLYYKASSEVK